MESGIRGSARMVAAMFPAGTAHPSPMAVDAHRPARIPPSREHSIPGQVGTGGGERRSRADEFVNGADMKIIKFPAKFDKFTGFFDKSDSSDISSRFYER